MVVKVLKKLLRAHTVLSGDEKKAKAWRIQLDAINGNGRAVQTLRGTFPTPKDLSLPIKTASQKGLYSLYKKGAKTGAFSIHVPANSQLEKEI